MENDHSTGTKYEDLACPECGSPMELAFSDRFRYRDGRRRPFYRCYKWPECTGYHGAHPNGAPLGKPANKETRTLRSQVHAELNKLFPWKTKKGRRATNRWLLEHNFGDGHVGAMDAVECRTALSILTLKK